MNDYQMTSLANDRTRQLLAEADQYRLARRNKRPGTRPTSSRARGSRRISLDFLFGRSPA